MPTALYTADVVCPMTGPPLADAGVLVDAGRIVDIGTRAELAGRADRVAHTAGVMLPGLVDALSRVEHADAVEVAAAASVADWEQMLGQVTESWTDERWTRSAHRGVQQLLRAGVTLARDVVGRGPGVPALARAGLLGDSLVDVRGVDVRTHARVLADVERSLGLPSGDRRVGVAVGGPHVVGSGVLQALGDLAVRRRAPLMVAAATCREEVQAIRDGSGPLADAARQDKRRFEWLKGTGLTPARYLDRLGVLRPGAAVAHGVWLDEGEIGMLSGRGVSLVSCPRADGARGAGDAPVDHVAAAGLPLALGSAGPAAAGIPDPLAEAADWVALAQRRGLESWVAPDAADAGGTGGPMSLAEAAVRLITVAGAAALGWQEQAGVLAPGRRADFTIVDIDTTTKDAYAALVADGPGRQVLTVLAGVRKARRPDADDPWPPIDHERCDHDR